MELITINDLGVWNTYTPEILPEGAPPSAMFSRREADGRDWYLLARNPSSWAPDSLKAVLMPTDAGWLVQAVVRDPSKLFPQSGQRLVEIIGHDPADEAPHKAYEQQLLDIETGEFSALPPPPVVSVSKAQGKIALRKAGLLDRVKALIEDADEELKIWWEDAGTWERKSAYIADMASRLDLTPAAVDDLFTFASTVRT